MDENRNGPRTRVVMLMRQFHPIRGGYENQALRLACEMIRCGVAVRVVTLRHPGLAPRETHRGLVIDRVPSLGTGHLGALVYLIGSLRWMIRHRREFDLIHANRSTSGLIAGVCGALLRKPVLYKLTRGDEIDRKGLRGSAWFGRLKLACLRRTVDRFVAITSEMVEDLRRIGVPARKIVQIPNGIEPESNGNGDRDVTRAALGFSEATRVAIYVGRLIPEKGVDWLLAAWARFQGAAGDVRLLVVGEGPERERLQKEVKRLDLGRTVCFLGQRNDVACLLAAADLFVLPSRLEGVSNALLEAMSQGLPVIVGDDRLGGNREIVREGVDGVLAPVDDTKALADALTRLLGDPGLRARLGANARASIERRFSIESVAARYRALYDEILAPEGDESRWHWRAA